MNSRQNIFIFSLIIILLTPGWSVFASEKSPGNLYALSAVLMDGDSGRVLYQKSGNTPRPNASTTKVMTAFLLLKTERAMTMSKFLQMLSVNRKYALVFQSENNIIWKTFFIP